MDLPASGFPNSKDRLFLALGPIHQRTLFYDGDCGLCRRSAGWARRLSGMAVRRRPVGTSGVDADAAAFLKRAVGVVEPDGRVWRGAAALFRVWDQARPGNWGGRLYARYRSFAALCEMLYAILSRMRGPLSTVLDAVLGPPPEDL